MIQCFLETEKGFQMINEEILEDIMNKKKILNNNVNKSRDKLYIEFMRIFAIFFVIFNHTGIKGFFLFSIYERGSIRYWMYLFVSIFCKFSVPLFLMMAGALLLTKDYNIIDLWKNKIARFFSTLCFFSSLYYVINYLFDRSAMLTLKGFIETLYTSTTSVHLWYLYEYLAMLIILPFLHAMVKGIDKNKKKFHYLILIWFIFSAMRPCLEFFYFKGNNAINSSFFNINSIFSDIIIFPLVGYYLENIVDINDIHRKHIVIMWIMTGITTFISAFMTFYIHGITGICNEGQSQAFHMTFVLIHCIAIYITTKKIFMKYDMPQLVSNLIRILGSCTFGVYLFHAIVLRESDFMWKILYQRLGLMHIVPAMIVSLTTIVICGLVTFVLKKVPIFRKIL